MAKIKISILVEVEYEPNPKYYPAGSTIDEMLAIDLGGVNEDPYPYFEMDGANMTITGEIVN